MKVAIECALVLALAALGGLNVLYNPFLKPNVAYAFNEGQCEGDPPGDNCECCECGCWICD
jgi:hypothetical protein